MGSLTVKIPGELERSMKEFKLDWSEVAFKAIADKAEKLKRLKELSSKIKVSKKDEKAFIDKISKGIAKKFLGVSK